MNIQKLSPRLGICGQVELSDIPEIVRNGYRLLVCNRPDDEERGQPGFAEIAEAAQAAGLAALYLPVAGPSDFASQAPAMAEAMRTASGPVLAYCRSGARSSMLCTAALAP